MKYAPFPQLSNESYVTIEYVKNGEGISYDSELKVVNVK